MSEIMSSSAQKVQDALKVHGVACRVTEMKQTTRSAQEAADAVGCQVGQIAKSLIFCRKKIESTGSGDCKRPQPGE